jgi:hypothetical protein
MKKKQQPPPRPKQQQPPPPPSDSSSAGEPQPDDEFLRITADIPDAVESAPAPAAQQAPEPDVIAPELIASALAPTFQAVFHFVATKRGSHWELIEFEKTALVKGWTPIMQYLLAKLGNQEQVLLTLAIMSTAAIVAGKAAQDIKRVSSMASTRMPASAASSASSASAIPERPPAPASSYEEQGD